MNHGSPSTYTHHKCRCDVCVTAHRRRMKHYQARYFRGRTRIARAFIDATPVREHLTALVASGWTGAALSRETGLSPAVLSELRTGRQSNVTPPTAATILAVGVLEPVDCDDVVVLRLVTGFPDADWRALGATRTERLAAFARLDFRDRRDWLTARGYADQLIELPSSERVRNYLGLRTADVKRVAS